MESSIVNWILLSLNAVLVTLVGYFLIKLISKIDENSRETSRLSSVLSLITHRIDVFETNHLVELKRRIDNMETDLNILGDRDHELANSLITLQSIVEREDDVAIQRVSLTKRRSR